MTLPALDTLGVCGGETTEITTVGALLFRSPVATGIALGYASERITGLKNNALVIGATNLFVDATPRNQSDEP